MHICNDFYPISQKVYISQLQPLAESGGINISKLISQRPEMHVLHLLADQILRRVLQLWQSAKRLLQWTTRR